jgi:xylose isomerase
MSRISISFSKLNYLPLKIMTSSWKSFQDVQYYTFDVDMVPKSWQTQNSSMEFLVLEWDIFLKMLKKLNEVFLMFFCFFNVLMLKTIF